MSRKKDSLLYKKDIKTLKEAIEYIEKLKNRIRRDDIKIRNLSSENKAYQKVWDKTEDYLQEVTAGKPLSELINTSKKGGRLQKNNGSCPQCSSKNLNKLLFTGFHVIVCGSCVYRERVDEAINTENE